jgi:putative aldouronate transport system substrate-binding protein
MKRFKKILTTMLVFAILFSLVACTGGKGSNADNPSGTDSLKTAEISSDKTGVTGKELYKVDVFTMLGNYAGEQTGWFAKIVKDKFNMELNMIASNIDGGGDVKLATMMASGNLGDIIAFGGDDEKYLDSIKGGFLLDMTKDGLLDKYGKDIVANYPLVLQKAKVQFGGGTSVYGLGYNAAIVTGGASEGEDMTWGPDLRWDLYEKLGRPVIKTMEDYLPVLKQMQQLEPKTETGKPTYGFSLWADWDTDKMCLAKQYCNVYGYDECDGFNPLGFALVSASEDKYQELLDEDSYYIKCLKLYFNANRMGLMDPDSISQKYEDVVNKTKDGQTLFSWFPWMDNIYNTPERQAQGKGFKLVTFKEEKIYSVGYNPYGGSRLIAIGSKAKYPDRIMEFINWLYTPDGFMTSKNGPKGLAWDLRDGKPYLTDFGKKVLPSNSPEPVPEEYGGGTWKDGNCQINIDPVHPTSINPQIGEPYDFHLWASYFKASPTKLAQDWSNVMGVMTSKEYFVKNNMISVCNPIFTGKAPDIMDKTLQQKKGQVANVIKQYSWQMVFAKNQADFDTLLNEMTAKAKGLGYNDVVKWNIDQAQKVYAWRESNK